MILIQAGFDEIMFAVPRLSVEETMIYVTDVDQAEPGEQARYIVEINENMRNPVFRAVLDLDDRVCVDFGEPRVPERPGFFGAEGQV